MRPTNKHERHQLDQRKAAPRDVRVKPSRMPTYNSWIKRQVMSGASPRRTDYLVDSDWDNLTGE